eukprot:8466873-Alexandrium_andersonii.AAC.1
MLRGWRWMASSIAVRTLVNGMAPVHPSCGAMPHRGRSGSHCIGALTRRMLCHCAWGHDRRRSQKQEARPAPLASSQG